MRVSLITESNQEYPIAGSTLIIGRDSDCDLRSKSRSVSRRHCAIIQKNDRVYAKDLGSSNGTYVNHVQLASGGYAELFDSDEIRVGQLEFRVSVLSEGTERPHVRTFDQKEPGDEIFSTVDCFAERAAESSESTKRVPPTSSGPDHHRLEEPETLGGVFPDDGIENVAEGNFNDAKREEADE